MIATDEVDEILLVCLKRRSGLLAGPEFAGEAAVGGNVIA
jgi:hypothetical protein